MTPTSTASTRFAHISTETFATSRPAPISSAPGQASRVMGGVMLALTVTTLALWVRTLCLFQTAVREGQVGRSFAAYACSSGFLVGFLLLAGAALSAATVATAVLFGAGSLACLVGNFVAQRELSGLREEQELEHLQWNVRRWRGIELLEGAREEEDIPRFRSHRADVQNRPRPTLHNLRQLLNTDGNARRVAAEIRVVFSNEGGTDAGGPRRELWTLLGQGIFRESSDENFLPARRSDEGFVPDLGVVNVPANPAEQRRRRAAARDSYIALGEVMSWGARKILRFPQVLAPRVFQAMKAQLDGDRDRVGLLAVYGQLGIEACFPEGERTDRQWQWLADQYGLLRRDAEDYDIWVQDWWTKSLEERKSELNHPGVLAQLRGWIAQEVEGAADAMAALVEGIGIDVGNQGLSRLRERNPAELRRLFLGELSADSLITRIGCSCPIHRRWLHNWIRQSSAHKLQLFVRAATGSATLEPGERIQMDMIGGGTVHTHTCGRMVDMPRQRSELEFFAALDAWVIVEGSGEERFNML